MKIPRTAQNSRITGKNTENAAMIKARKSPFSRFASLPSRTSFFFSKSLNFGLLINTRTHRRSGRERHDPV